MASTSSQVRIGVSGFSYKEWLGRFYPSDLKGPRMLAYYAERFGTVEINYTFRQMPRRELLERWAAETPLDFRFSFKAPQRITHQARLKNVNESVLRFADVTSVMGDRLGYVLFQLPPGFKRDVPLLDDFLSMATEKVRPVMEFRDVSWFDDSVYDTMRAHRTAFCINETERIPEPPLIRTTELAYLRLRRDVYTDQMLQKWAEAIVKFAASGGEICAYFRHGEDAPDYAQKLIGFVGAGAEPKSDSRKSR